jgi:class 3 adenylate cyclase
VGRKLTVAQLADEARVTVEDVQGFVAAGFLTPGDNGLYDQGDVMQIRLMQAFAEGGIELVDLRWALEEGRFPLARVGQMWTLAEPSGRTFAEFAASLGEHGPLLPSIYAAFGLAVPADDSVMRRDEEEALSSFVEVWSLVEDRPETYQRAARITGEGVRRITAAISDLFGDLGGAPPSRRRRGMGDDEAYAPSLLLGPSLQQSLVWLLARHSEHEVFERIVRTTERVLANAGRGAQRTGEPPAIAFVDLSGYTSMTASAGDEHAAEAATTLHDLALAAAHEHGGRVVKLLGDGVLLRYSSATEAVESVTALMAAVERAGLPIAHAGIAAGPIVTRDGDVYGHTVNLAARVASHASAGELLVPAELAGHLRDAGIACDDAGEASFRGVAEPTRLVRVIGRG